MNKPTLDKVLFSGATLSILTVVISLAFMAENAAPFVASAYNWVSFNLGFSYQLSAIFCMGFLAWLACSRYGDIRLSQDDQPAEFSTISWAGMLFCAGTGAALLTWSSVEWIPYYLNPPFNVEARSTAAVEWASAYGAFHWGLTAWCFYAITTIAIAYPFYCKGIPYLRASTALHGLLGASATTTASGRATSRAVDLAAMIALIGGTATSLGTILSSVASCIAELFDLETSFGLQLTILLCCVALYSCSIFFGLTKGIKRLSNINVALCCIFLAFIFVFGPTLFIIKNSLNTLGFMVDNFIRMISWTDPVEATGFVESWTIFYWAWWIAFAPAIGIFVSRISKGRSIRQVIIGMIFFGSLGCWGFYFVLGNYSLFLEIENILPVTQISSETGLFSATSAILKTLPLPNLVLTVFSITCLVAMATTFDSASYTLASTATLELHADANPAVAHQLYWGFMLAVLPLVMITVGGLEIIKAGVLLSSLPLFLVGIAMAISLTRSLREEALVNQQG